MKKEYTEDVSSGEFEIPLDIYTQPSNKKEEFCGSASLTTIASLFVDYLPDWQDKLRECMILAEKDNALSTSDNLEIKYLLFSGQNRNQ